MYLDKLLSLLKALKIFDPDNTLSLTNLALIVLIAKLTTAQQLPLEHLAALFMALVSYNGKKFLRYKTEKRTESTEKSIQNIQDQVKSLTSAVSLKNLQK